MTFSYNVSVMLKVAFLVGKKISPKVVESLEVKSQSPTHKELTENSNSVLSTGLDNLVREYYDLTELVKLWSDPPERIRTAIKTIVETPKAQKEQTGS